MQEIEVRLIADAGELERELGSLSDILQLPLEIRDRLINAFSSGSQALRLDCEDASAGRTGDLRISIKLSDCMRGFVAALGTRNQDRVVVDERHPPKRSAIGESS